MRTCATCGQWKREADFAVTGYKRKRDGVTTRKRHCKECAAKKTKEWCRKHPKAAARHSRDWRERNRFRHALAVTRRMSKRGGYEPCYASQSHIEEQFTGVCCICGAKEAECSTKLHLDHDHATGRFRGWLCSTCNTGIGMFHDSTHLLVRALEYLTP